MAAKAKLKVYRTAIGFEDAYVAAPSQKAALEAWGTTKNLFARGGAEVVSDPALTKAALASPGKVVRVKRGTLEQHLAAATPVPQRRVKPVKPAAEPAAPPSRRKPRPSRAALDRAEQAIEAASARQEMERRALADEIERLRAKLERLAEHHEAALAKLEARRDAAAARYRDALEVWSGA
jgi:hypothetical protein